MLEWVPGEASGQDENKTRRTCEATEKTSWLRPTSRSRQGVAQKWVSCYGVRWLATRCLHRSHPGRISRIKYTKIQVCRLDQYATFQKLTEQAKSTAPISSQALTSTLNR